MDTISIRNYKQTIKTNIKFSWLLLFSVKMVIFGHNISLQTNILCCKSYYAESMGRSDASCFLLRLPSCFIFSS